MLRHVALVLQRCAVGCPTDISSARVRIGREETCREDGAVVAIALPRNLAIGRERAHDVCVWRCVGDGCALAAGDVA